MKPCYNCEDRQMAAAGAIAAAAVKVGTAIKGMLPGATSAAGNMFANQKTLEWSAPECGKRPFFIGKRRNEWEQCAAIAAQKQQIMPGTNLTERKSFLQQNKTPLLIGGALVGGLILFNVLNKK